MNKRIRALLIGSAMFALGGATVGTAVAASTASEPQPSMPAMPMGMDTSMMTMPDGTDMSSMHEAMRSMMSDMLPADQLAACDAAHSQMAPAPVTTTTGAGVDTTVDHAAHHG